MYIINGRELGRGPEGITAANYMLAVMLGTLALIADAEKQTGE
jgi:hypothetical protein